MRNLDKALLVRRPADIAKIRALMFEQMFRLGHSDKEVEMLWDAYSDDHAAGWLIVDKDSVSGFITWLQT